MGALHGPWVGRQTWVNLLFAHWPIDVSAARELVPRGIDVDTFDGRTWAGVVSFGIQDTALRGMPAVPGISRFPELNLRLYVNHDGSPGVWFLSLDAANPAAVWAARKLLSLPYQNARMTVRTRSGIVEYRSERCSRIPVGFQATYGPRSGIFTAAPGSLEHWLTERYCLYSERPDGSILRLDISHPPWRLQLAHALIARNDLARPFGIELKGEPLLHFAARQRMRMWLPVTVAA